MRFHELNEHLNESAAAREVSALPRRRQASPQHKKDVVNALKLYERACSGNAWARAELKEALSTSDFSFIFGDVMHRQLMTTYASIDPIWPKFAQRTTLVDFRPKKMVDLLGGRSLLERVEQLAPYPQRAPLDNEYEISVQKYGGAFSLSWEDTINDDLGALRALPSRLGEGARDTEDFVATNLLASSTGPNSTFFSSTALSVVSPGTSGGNLLAGNPALSTDSLSAAITAIQSRRDVDNRPIPINGFILVVPPSLEVTARNILQATELRFTTGGETTIVGNWLSGKINLVVNYWLPVVDTSANSATTWYVLPAPTNPRPALVVGFLAGHETPDLRYRDAAGVAVGGGQVPAQEGSFEVDDIAYRIRHILGSVTLDPISTAVSNGSGA